MSKQGTNRAYVMNAPAAFAGVVIAGPCMLDAIIQTRALNTFEYQFFDALDDNGFMFLRGSTDNAILKATQMQMPLYNGLFVKTIDNGGGVSPFFTFLAAPRTP